MSERTFIVKVTETVTTKYRLTEEEARKAFPLIRWDEEDVSHAGDMEDEVMGGAGLPKMIRDMDVDDHDEDVEYRVWEE